MNLKISTLRFGSCVRGGLFVGGAFISLSSIDDGSVWLLWTKEVVDGSRLGSGVMYQSMRKRISIKKSCTCRDRVLAWFSVGL